MFPIPNLEIFKRNYKLKRIMLNRRPKIKNKTQLHGESLHSS